MSDSVVLEEELVPQETPKRKILPTFFAMAGIAMAAVPGATEIFQDHLESPFNEDLTTSKE